MMTFNLLLTASSLSDAHKQAKKFTFNSEVLSVHKLSPHSDDYIVTLEKQ